MSSCGMIESRFTGKCTIYAADLLIGTAMLTSYDRGMNVYGGRFVPTEAYGRCRSVFLLYSEAALMREETGREDNRLLQRFFQERDRLNLQARTAGGITIPTTAITIIDFTDEIPGDELEIEILVDDPHTHLTAAETE